MLEPVLDELARSIKGWVRPMNRVPGRSKKSAQKNKAAHKQVKPNKRIQRD